MDGLIIGTGTAEFLNGQPVRHHVSATQVIVPEPQVLLDGFALCRVDGRIVQRSIKGFDRVSYGGRESLGSLRPVDGQSCAKDMPVGEFPKRRHRDVPQKVPSVENLHCCSPFTMPFKKP
jgi:hypothetical protein